jgi:short-subunit dehydrogenase
MIVAGHPVKVTCVHPGGIKTAIVRNATTAEGLDKDRVAKTLYKRLATTCPRKAALVILDGVRKNKPRVLVGKDARALDILARATGSGYQRLIAAVRSRTMTA